MKTLSKVKESVLRAVPHQERNTAKKVGVGHLLGSRDRRDQELLHEIMFAPFLEMEKNPSSKRLSMSGWSRSRRR